MGGASGKRAEARGGGGAMGALFSEVGTCRSGRGRAPEVAAEPGWAGSAVRAPSPGAHASSPGVHAPSPGIRGASPGIRGASPGIRGACASPGASGRSPCASSAGSAFAGLGGAVGRGGTEGGGGVPGRGGTGARRASVLMHPPFPHVPGPLSYAGRCSVFPARPGTDSSDQARIPAREERHPGGMCARERSSHACASLYGLTVGEREPVRDPVCICPEHPPTLR